MAPRAKHESVVVAENRRREVQLRAQHDSERPARWPDPRGARRQTNADAGCGSYPQRRNRRSGPAGSASGGVSDTSHQPRPPRGQLGPVHVGNGQRDLTDPVQAEDWPFAPCERHVPRGWRLRVYGAGEPCPPSCVTASNTGSR